MAAPTPARALRRPDHPMSPASRRELRWDLLAVLAGTVLVVAAAIEGWRLINAGVDIFLFFPPLLANWDPHVGPGTVPAVVTAVAVVVAGPGLAARLRWRTLLLVGWLTAVVWTTSLALVDGWSTGLAGRLASDQEYVDDVPRVTATAEMLREFTTRLFVDHPDPWATHVAGHPPGALLVFVWLDRLGLGGGGAAGLFAILVGAAAGVAIAVTLRSLGSEELARRVLPFAVLVPGAVWVGVSADGMFAGVLAWGVALLSVAATNQGWRADAAALAAGLLLGFTLYLSYGLVLAGLIAAAVVAVTRRARPVLIAGVAALGVAVAFTVSGFWWFTGLDLLRVLYAASIAKTRPYEYFWWANIAALLFVIGPAVLAGLRRMAWHPRALAMPAVLLTAAALGAIVLADISGLSKGEVERIWLPFALWLTVATALLPRSQQRGWLAAQALLAVAVNHLLITVW